MGWLPFSKSSNTVKDANTVQKSHQPLNGSNSGIPDSSVPNSDISHTLDQITDSQQQLTVKQPRHETVSDFNKLVTDFVQKRPENMFVIDGEKEIQESIICTNNETGGKTCLKLQYNSIQLFKHMQTLEYFCSLPDDINATYFECRKIK